MKESIPRSKAVRERAKAAQVRVGKQAIATTLKTEARGAKKLEKVMEAASGENPGYCYAVLVDTQGVAYLRVEETDKGAKYVITTGAEIQVVELDNGTIRSRRLKVVPEASVAEAAGILARPLVKSVIISKRANEYLNKILSDKEFMTMATATKKAKKAATKSSAAAKTGKAKSEGRSPKFGDDAVVKLLKGPSDEQIKRHVTILSCLKEAGKALSIAALGKALAKASGTKQDGAKVVRMHLKALTEGGFVNVVPA